MLQLTIGYCSSNQKVFGVCLVMRHSYKLHILFIVVLLFLLIRSNNGLWNNHHLGQLFNKNRGPFTTINPTTTSESSGGVEPTVIPIPTIEDQQPVRLYPVTSPVIHAEGPFFDDENQVLYFVDIAGRAVHKVDFFTSQHTFVVLNDTVSFVIPVKNKDNQFAIGLGRNVEILTWDGLSEDYDLKLISALNKGDRLNDGKASPNGILWTGTIGRETPPSSGNVEVNQSALYSYSPGQGEMVIKLEPVTNSNGLAWSKNGKTFFYIDTSTREIARFDYDASTLSISNRRVAFDFKTHNVSGYPDGMTIDENNHLWIACFGGGRVIQVDPYKNKLIKTIRMPVEKITSAEFGGPRKDILFVTSSRGSLSASENEKQPLAGSVFAITNLGVKGLTNVRTVFDNDGKKKLTNDIVLESLEKQVFIKRE